MGCQSSLGRDGEGGTRRAVDAVTTAWQRFKDSLDRGITSREDLESLDLSALMALNPLERGRARELLAARIGEGDPRIVDALANIDAWDEVEKAFASDYGSALVHAATWLWRHNQDPRVLPRLRDEALKNPDAPTYVSEVLLALANLPGESVEDAFVEVLVSTQQPRVAIAAREQLYLRLGWSEWEHEGSPLFALTCGMRSNFPSVRARSFEQLRDLLRRHRASQSDAELGLVARPLEERSLQLLSLLQLAFHPDSAPFPSMSTIDQLRGGERVWAIDLLLARLEQKDTRVIPLLEHLGGERIQLALDDHRKGRWIP